MSNRSADRWSRREFLTTVAAAGTGVVLGLRSEAIAAEPPAGDDEDQAGPRP